MVAILAAALLCPALALARTLTWANAADAVTLDPHSLAEGLTLALNQQIYEPLITRDAQGKTQPALAESWTLTSDPLVWEFHLRAGVTFHDGTRFGADDVVFSIQRARQVGSDLRDRLSSIDTVTKVDNLTIRIKTKGPDPLLPATLPRLLIMSREWSDKNGAAKVQDLRLPDETFASRNANGTGPFKLVSREPGKRTVMRRYENYWGLGTQPIEVSELIFRPIKSDAERVASLIGGDVDFIQDVPVGDTEKLEKTPGIVVNVGPENRAIFLGLNVGDSELRFSNVEGKNPLADRRVRQAINIAVNRQAIQRDVMQGHSIPTGIIVPETVNGYTRQLDVIPATNTAKARALMADAGYATGFTISLHCTNGRYVADVEICKTLVTQLAAIGIRVELITQAWSAHAALILSKPPGTDFYLLGWSVPTFDSEPIFSSLFHSRTDDLGQWNATRYANPQIDRLIRSLHSEVDFIKRNQTINQIWRTVQEETIYIPLHLQTLAYAMKSELDIPVDIENQPKLKTVKFKRTQ
jgi:peptide/nickel transport system substrate-binding protein